jgi:hypothetical protein
VARNYGTFSTFSSDHAPNLCEHPGGKKLGVLTCGKMSYRHIQDGLPTVETRLPLLISQAKSRLESIPFHGSFN